MQPNKACLNFLSHYNMGLPYTLENVPCPLSTKPCKFVAFIRWRYDAMMRLTWFQSNKYPYFLENPRRHQQLPYFLENPMRHQQWSKFLLYLFKYKKWVWEILKFHSNCFVFFYLVIIFYHLSNFVMYIKYVLQIGLWRKILSFYIKCSWINIELASNVCFR